MLVPLLTPNVMERLWIGPIVLFTRLTSLTTKAADCREDGPPLWTRSYIHGPRSTEHCLVVVSQRANYVADTDQEEFH